MCLNGHDRLSYYFLGRARIDCDPDRVYLTIVCTSGQMDIHEHVFWIYGAHTRELNKLGLWFFHARVRVHRFHAAQIWLKERAKHIFAPVTPRLTTTIPRLAVAILCWTLCIPNSNSDLKNEQKLRMFAYNAKIFGSLLPTESEEN